MEFSFLHTTWFVQFALVVCFLAVSKQNRVLYFQEFCQLKKLYCGWLCAKTNVSDKNDWELVTCLASIHLHEGPVTCVLSFFLLLPSQAGVIVIRMQFYLAEELLLSSSDKKALMTVRVMMTFILEVIQSPVHNCGGGYEQNLDR